MKILLQFPQGLKQYAIREADALRQEGHEIYLSATPCWGACDLAIDEAKKIGAQKLIHYGHAQFHKVNEPNLEIEYRLYPITADLSCLSDALDMLAPYKKLAIVTTVSHIHQLEDMKKILKEAGHEVFTSKGGLAIMEGQVLGCDSSAADKLAEKVDAIVYFGGGEFHPLGITSKKPILAASPYAKKAYWLNDNIEKKRKKEKGMLIGASSAKSFGIIVSIKSGQFNLAPAKMMQKALQAIGKRAEILIAGEVDFHSLADFNSFDAFITTACPRLIDDSERVGKPIINISQFRELELLIKETS